MLSRFRNEAGSTTLTIIISIVVVICLLSASLQWYWANCSAGDVQLAADLGAMGYQEVIARVVLTVQVFNATIFAANILGLILHGLVVVNGIATLAQATYGGGVNATLMPKLIEIDKSYVQRRQKFTDALFSAAEKLNEIAPYMAFGYASKIVEENNAFRREFNNAQYGAIPLAFPSVGTVERASSSALHEQTLTAALDAHDQASSHARRVKQLEERVVALRDACFALDPYKDADARDSWEPKSAPADFQRELKRLASDVTATHNTLIPIEEESFAAQQRLAEAYKRDIEAIQERVLSVCAHAFSVEDFLNCVQVSSSDLFAPWEHERVYVVLHEPGERKAYHTTDECSGLARAGEPAQPHALGEVINDNLHPPCSLCAPTSWQALAAWRTSLNELLKAWNEEVIALDAYAQAQEELNNEEAKLQEETREAFTSLLASAKELLASDRIRYLPPGRRGVVCISFSKGERTPPAFTLAALTRTTDERPRAQFALAAARLKPVLSPNTIGWVMDEQRSYYNRANRKLGSGVFAFLDGNNDNFGDLSSLWGSALDMSVNRTNSLGSLGDSLPWGIGPLLNGYVRDLAKLAGVDKPDTRNYRPFLVNSADVGDKAAGGIEGQFVAWNARLKDAHEASAKLAENEALQLMREAVAAVDGITYTKLRSNQYLAIFDTFMAAPFPSGLFTSTPRAVEAARDLVSTSGWN